MKVQNYFPEYGSENFPMAVLATVDPYRVIEIHIPALKITFDDLTDEAIDQLSAFYENRQTFLMTYIEIFYYRPDEAYIDHVTMRRLFRKLPFSYFLTAAQQDRLENALNNYLAEVEYE